MRPHTVGNGVLTGDICHLFVGNKVLTDDIHVPHNFVGKEALIGNKSHHSMSNDYLYL